ncbi:EF-hand domain-containing protein [Streptomyces erythrochromogenes]|uniref:EF-hand domain-containing protein n=1 Tax=Streptomyces erythrochromogenes TaxID=285574 RepID=UPI0038709DF7|nr:EF-hand domain-containing protein [Streptomyces erythrochromogenes]
MTTALLKTKHDKLFDLLDRNRNGVLEMEDFDLLAADLIAAGADNPRARSAGAVRDAYRRAFARFAAHADTDGDGTVSREEFHAAMATPADRVARFEDIWGPTCDVEFDNVDIDGDGRLNEKEFAMLMAGFGHAPASASAAFGRIADGGEFISRSAYYRAWQDYVAGDDTAAAANSMMP